jgi:hypothetical protein
MQEIATPLIVTELTVLHLEDQVVLEVEQMDARVVV